MGGSVSCEGVGGFVALFFPILPRQHISQHHPRVYQAEYLNIFTSLIESGAREAGEESNCLLFPVLLVKI